MAAWPYYLKAEDWGAETGTGQQCFKWHNRLHERSDKFSNNMAKKFKH